MTDFLKKTAKAPLKLVGWSAQGTARLIVEGLHAALMTVVTATIVLVVYVKANTQDLPSLRALQTWTPATVNRIYAADGSLISEYARQRRVFIAIDRIPERVQQAFIAAEDQRFRDHHGIDVQGIGRAARANVRKLFRGGALQGASTITQQVAKNILLTPERSVRRKVREMVLATRMEQAFTKKRILEIYLNALYLGERAYGVSAAAQTYFGKGLDQLTIAEAAMLAGLAQSPSRHNPLRHPDDARKRRDYVLRRMRVDGYITAEAYRQAISGPVKLAPQRNPVRRPGHGYVVDEVRRSLARAYGKQKMARGGYTVRTSINDRMQKIGRRTLREALIAYDRRHGYRGPLLNITDAGLELSHEGDDGWKSVLDHVATPAGIGDWRVAIVLRVGTRRADIGITGGQKGAIPVRRLKWARAQVVRALKSGRRYKTASRRRVTAASDVLRPGDVILVSRRQDDKPGEYRLEQVPEVAGALVAMEAQTGRVLAMIGGYSFAQSEFNNATQAWRQPGSAFKPILFAAALEQGFTPSTLINDAPFKLQYRGVYYRPKNYTGKYYGPTTLRVALERSRNVSSMRLALRIGILRVASLAQRLNIAPRMPLMPSMVLGSRETTAMRLAAAYATLVNGGRLVRPSIIDRVQAASGRTIFRQERRVCSYCGNVRWEGQGRPWLTDRRRRIISAHSAFQITHMMRGVVQRGTGKRIKGLKIPIGGKTGTTNDSMDAWFVGFTPDLVVAVWMGFPKTWSLGPKEEGGRTAAPVFRTFIQRAMKGRPSRDFVAPKGLIKVAVNPVTGLPSRAGRVIDDYFKPGKIPTLDGAFVPDGGLQHQPSYLSENRDGESDGDAAAKEEKTGPTVRPDQLSGTEY